jgi:hypothetical protein
MNHKNKTSVQNRFAIITLVIVAAGLLGCAGLKPAVTSQPANVQTASVSFSKDSAIEVAFSSLKEGKRSQFFHEYFPKVMPIMQEYHGSVLMSHIVKSYLVGNMKSQTVGFFAWPSVKAFLSIVQDERLKSLMPIRNDALSFINEGNFFVVEKDITVKFTSNKTYAVCAVWMKSPKVDDKLPNSHALLELRPLKETIGSYTPTLIRLFDVEQFTHNGQFDQMAVYRDGFNCRPDEVERLDILLTNFAFPVGKK